MKVEDILHAKGTSVITVRAADSVAEALRLLNTHNIGALAVIGDDGRLEGVLSERDIIRRLTGAETDLFSRRVETCMTRVPHTCTRDTPIDDIMQLMTNRRIRHVPVVEGGVLCGLVSIGDVVKRKIELAEREASALRDYIAS